jgi:hypothetical protein
MKMNRLLWVILFQGFLWTWLSIGIFSVAPAQERLLTKGAEEEEDLPEVRALAERPVRWRASKGIDPAGLLDVRILAINDFHGQLSEGRRVGGRPVGGAGGDHGLFGSTKRVSSWQAIKKVSVCVSRHSRESGNPESRVFEINDLWIPD